MRLIDADAFIEKLAHVPMVQDAIKKAMDTMPTVDAVPVRHGRWISRPAPSNSYCGYLICSNCGEEVSDADEYNYCPNCGVRMSEDD